MEETIPSKEAGIGSTKSLHEYSQVLSGNKQCYNPSKMQSSKMYYLKKMCKCFHPKFHYKKFTIRIYSLKGIMI